MNSEQKLYKNRQWLERKYVDEGLTMRQIAEICGVDGKTIFYHLRKFCIETRGRCPQIKDGRFLQFRVPLYVFDALSQICQKRQEKQLTQ